MNRYEFYGNINTYRRNQTNKENELMHYGTLGQKWGVRKWQNPDGTFNEAGKERYFGTGKFKPVSKEEKIGAQKYNYRTGQYYDTKYQNQDGTLTKKGEKRLQKYINKPEGLFSNVNGKISIEAYNKATGNNVIDRKKEAEKEAYNKLLNNLEEKDKNITVKYDLKGKNISQEEFDKAAKEIKDTFDNMESWDDDYNEIADLGLYKMIKNNTLGNDCKPGDKWDRFWFMEEDQTDGYPEITDLYRKGYSREYIKQFTDKLADMDYDEAENISTSLAWGSRNVDNILNDIIGPKEQKIGTSYKMSPWEKKAEKNRLKDLKDDYKNNKKNMTKDEFEKWKEDTENKEKQRKIDKKEFADIQELKENIAKGKKISEKEYDKLSEEGKKIYNASQEMKENGWDVESKKDNPNSKYTQRVDLLFTKKLDNKDFGDKFTVYQKDLTDIKDFNNKATKAMNFLNKKDSYDKIVNNLLNEQYEIYKDVTKKENRKNIMSKSEFFESEKPYVKEVGFDTWGGGDGSIGIDFEPKNPNTSWFGYGFEVWVDPSTGKITDYYQS